MLRVAEAIARTDTGRQRRGNEDSSYARPPLFVVADGMGGAQAGEVASQIAVQTFERGLPDSGNGEERLAVRVQEANEVIHRRSRGEPELDGMGTTVTAALLEDEHVAVAHVGDSRAYRFRDGELKRLTQDHSLVDELVRQGKLTEQQAAEHPQRSIITRALGPEPTVEVDTGSYPARAGDVLLLCSDGLTSMIPETLITEILAGPEPLAGVADKLIAAANAAGGRDNITVVLFRIEEVAGGGPDTEQPTIVAAPGPSSDAGPRASAGDGDGVPVASPPAFGAGSEASGGARTAVAERVLGPRLARTQGRPPPAPPPRRRSEKLIKPVSALVATGIVLFLIGGGGYIATRQLYFLGTNAHAIVTVYRGLPYELPFGIKLYETFYTSGVPAALVPADRRTSLFDHHLRSQSGATKLVTSLERGDISR